MSKDLYHPGKKTWAYYTLYFVSRILSPFFYKIEYTGADNLPKSGPVLLLAKHQHLTDIPLGFVMIHRKTRKDIWCVMKDSLAQMLGGFFMKTGGIPLNRKNPEKSKWALLYARDRLYEGNIVVLFPEQTRFPDIMGKGKTPGFRFIAGKPATPLAVNVIGFRYEKAFPRTKVHLRIGKTTYYEEYMDADEFLHDRMHEMASLSLLTYPYERSKKVDTE